MDLTLNISKIRNTAQYYHFMYVFALICWGFLFYSKTFCCFCKAIYNVLKSDIKKLTWEEIQPYGSDGVMYVTTRMQKTKDIVHNPISEEALELIGYSL